jgi:RimJ/RimL family protein N-acetyltransferase
MEKGYKHARRMLPLGSASFFVFGIVSFTYESTNARASAPPQAPGLVIRPIHASDASELQAGFERLSEASRYYRFHSGMRRIPDSLLRYLTQVDGIDHVALVGFEPSNGAEGRGVAVARFVRDRQEPTTAELAVVVIDELQGRGIAGRLLAKLGEAAAERGIESFKASVLSGNKRARGLLKRLGAVAKSSPGELMAFEIPVHALIDAA